MTTSKIIDDPYHLLDNLVYIDRIVIPEFIESVTLSNKRRAIYFRENADFIERTDGKAINLSIIHKDYKARAKMLRLKRVHKKHIASKFKIGIQGYLTDKSGERVLANPIAAGTPKKMSINFQNLYSGKMNHYMRAEVVKAVKNNMLSHVIAAVNRNITLDSFPLYIIMKYCNTEKKNGSTTWDVGNACILYTKCFLDLISTGTNGDTVAGRKKIQYFEPLIPDDQHTYVRADPWPLFIPVEKSEDRKLIFEFFKLRT
jgi:hypothetical protein